MGHNQTTLSTFCKCLYRDAFIEARELTMYATSHSKYF